MDISIGKFRLAASAAALVFLAAASACSPSAPERPEKAEGSEPRPGGINGALSDLDKTTARLFSSLLPQRAGKAAPAADEAAPRRDEAPSDVTEVIAAPSAPPADTAPQPPALDAPPPYVPAAPEAAKPMAAPAPVTVAARAPAKDTQAVQRVVPAQERRLAGPLANALVRDVTGETARAAANARAVRARCATQACVNRSYAAQIARLREWEGAD